jgi:hypothetical protein
MTIFPLPKATRKPTVLVTEKALADMTLEVLENPDIETAWGLVGFIFGGGETVIVTNVVRPDPTEVARQYATTNLGGDQQVEALRWLTANYELIRSHKGVTTEATYGFLFKGHSHHQLGFSGYSSTDFSSLVESVEKDGLVVAIGPLANIREHKHTVAQIRGGLGGAKVDIHHQVDFTFYYLSQKMLAEGQRVATTVQPTIIKATDVFMPVPELGWQFVRRAEYLEQLRHLKAYGCSVNVVTRDAKAGPPLEVQFIVTKPGVWRGSLSIVTDSNFPASAPTFDVLSPTGPSKVAFLWVNSPEKQAGELWNKGEDLIESVFRLEARGQL